MIYFFLVFLVLMATTTIGSLVPSDVISQHSKGYSCEELALLKTIQTISIDRYSEEKSLASGHFILQQGVGLELANPLSLKHFCTRTHPFKMPFI